MMASITLKSLLLVGTCLISFASAINTQLVGTWSTKSAKVLTGQGFYNLVNDSFTEPRLTGISYSFTTDGYYEEAYYRAVSNPTKPSCPQAILQFQHGTFVENADGFLRLKPFAVDGRQLQSNPCTGSKSTYTRYTQPKTMAKYQVYEDPYTKLTRLELYKFDGSPMNPMFLTFNPPQMLPTTTMKPTAKAIGKASRAKRAIPVEMVGLLNRDATHINRNFERPLLQRIDLNTLWWSRLVMAGFGGAAYFL